MQQFRMLGDPPLARAHLPMVLFALAGIVKGVVGLGLPTVSMALLALWMPPAQAAALLIVPSFVTNVWQLRPLSTLGPLFKRILRMQYGVLAGTLAVVVSALGTALAAYDQWLADPGEQGASQLHDLLVEGSGLLAVGIDAALSPTGTTMR